MFVHLSLSVFRCGDLLWVPEGVVELPSGQFAENLSLNDLRKVLAELSLPRAGNRSEVYERLRVRLRNVHIVCNCSVYQVHSSTYGNIDFH